jgi:hypothetical protein
MLTSMTHRNGMMSAVDSPWPNHALQRTAAGRRGCNRRVSWPPSLSLGRWPLRIMQHKPSKIEPLIRGWRWVIGVALLLAIPTYGFASPIRYAVLAHVLATLIYVGLLLLFGQGFVIEGAIFAVILATLFALCSRPLHRFIHRQSVSLHETRPNHALHLTRPSHHGCNPRVPRAGSASLGR